jgi:hypothetical protein
MLPLSGANLTVVSLFAAVRSAAGLEGALAILFLSVIGAALFVGLVLCLRRFDVDRGTDVDGGGGGGGHYGPRPDDPAGSVGTLEPPLGEIRATRARPRRPIALERSGALD